MSMPSPVVARVAARAAPQVLAHWSWIAPLAAAAGLGVSLAWPSDSVAALVVTSLLLAAAVLAAVHHAEVVAHRVGEPFGSLTLAVAVTVIEVALIVSFMLVGGAASAGLARDTVYAAVMIVCNGVVGLCVLVGGLRHRVPVFRVDGTASALAVLASMAVLTLVVPSYTLSTVGPTLAPSQLVFSGLSSLVLYGAFVFVQTLRHRDYFLPESEDENEHAEPPSSRTAWLSLGLLLVCLVVVVGLAKALAPSLEGGVAALGLPKALVGVIVALLVLAPETLAALRAAARNRLQTSLNLALGSGIASIGLTIPVVAVLALVFGQELQIGLQPKETVLLTLTFMVATITLSRGRVTILQGVVHLVLFAYFLFLTAVP